MDPIDLCGLNKESARELVLGYLRSLKEVQRQLRIADSQVRLWESRMSLASEVGKHDLARRTAARVERARAQRAELSAEEQQVASIAGRLKDELKQLRSMPELSGIDAEGLLAELQSSTGEHDILVSEIADLEAEQRLSDLKSDIDNES